jgi:hypothetical protein
MLTNASAAFHMQDLPQSLTPSKRKVLNAVASEDVTNYHKEILKRIEK